MACSVGAIGVVAPMLAGCGASPVKVGACESVIENVHGSSHDPGTMDAVTTVRCYSQMYRVTPGGSIDKNISGNWTYVVGTSKSKSYWNVKHGEPLMSTTWSICLPGDFRPVGRLTGQRTPGVNLTYSPDFYSQHWTRNPCFKPFDFRSY
jgi:hypothetical protein